MSKPSNCPENRDRYIEELVGEIRTVLKPSPFLGEV